MHDTQHPFERRFRGSGHEGGRGSGHEGGRGSGHEGGRGGGPEGGRGHGRGHGGPGGRGGRGPRGGGGWQQADLPSADDAADWLSGRLPDGWFTGTPTVTVDREEIVVVGELPAPEGAPTESAETAATTDTAATTETAAAAEGRIGRFREDTRDARVRIAQEAEARYGRKIAWGASIGETRVLFTHLAVPVMTRLRHDERRVLDTLVDSGVARSRSDALGWCVKLVAEHSDEWLAGLRDAMAEVDKLRKQGPGA